MVLHPPQPTHPIAIMQPLLEAGTPVSEEPLNLLCQRRCPNLIPCKSPLDSTKAKFTGAVQMQAKGGEEKTSCGIFTTKPFLGQSAEGRTGPTTPMPWHQ